ncbi:MAG: DUF92 domain-containing protein [Bacteroidetes bacterium QS_3_64_15]|nr:MAG: DUF92 domain-containing protein [Bacteroidetes bacterium QS_3_64_15]
MSLSLLSVRDGWMALAALAGLGALVGLGEVLRARGVADRTTRRLVHVGVSLFVAATPFLFARSLPVYGLAAVFTLINARVLYRRSWPSIHEARSDSWGTVALPLSVLPALAATWSVTPDRLLAFQTAYLVLALADPAASWVGEGNSPESRSQGSTVAGSLTFAGITFILTASVLAAGVGKPGVLIAGIAAGTTLVATLVEAVSHRGWDNLFVVAAVILPLVPIQEQALELVHIGVALVAGTAFGGLAYAANALDERGAATGGLFAASLVGLGGWPWIVPGIVFFGLSSALTSIDWRDLSLSGESPRRTQVQVLANGGVAWAALAGAAVVPGLCAWSYAVFVGSLAAAAADTWATELGRWSPSPPWSLRDGKRVPTGTSGAVSVVGTSAALLGAASVVGPALLVNGPLAGSTPQNATLLLGAGMLGMGADSLAGAFLQAHYRASSGRLVETPPSDKAAPVQGWAGIGNNAVNFIGTAVGALVAVAGTTLVG